MIALKTGSRDFVLLPEHKMDADTTERNRFVVLYEGHMYLLHDPQTSGIVIMNIPKHNILEHVLTTMDCYL